MVTQVILECSAFPKGRTFSLEHANRLLKVQGNAPDGWKLKEGQKFELNDNGVIIRTSDQTNSEQGKQRAGRKGNSSRGADSVS